MRDVVDDRGRRVFVRRGRQATALRLAAGASGAGKHWAFAGAVPCVTVAGLLVFMAFDLLVEPFTERPFDLWGAFLPHLLIAPIVLFGAVVCVAPGYVMLRVVRSAAWLDGTVLHERLVLRRRAVDLRTAQVHIKRRDRRAAAFIARIPGEPSWDIELRVGYGTAGLPPGQLVALADALTGDRAGSGSDDPARRVAEQLREMACGCGASAPEPGRVDIAPDGQPPSRLRLSVGAGVAGRLIALVFAVVAAIIVAFLVPLAIRLATPAPGTPIAVVDRVADSGMGVLVLWVAYVVGLIGWALLEVACGAVWLEGTLLRERMIIRTDSVDLATACLDTPADRRTGRLRLVAMHPHTGECVRVPLHSRRKDLPSVQLVALADAMIAGGVRTADDAAYGVAGGLRALAAWRAGSAAVARDAELTR